MSNRARARCNCLWNSGSADPQIVHALKGSAATPADQRRTVAASEWIGNGLAADRAVKVHADLLLWHLFILRALGKLEVVRLCSPCIAAALLLTSAACDRKLERAPVIGESYAGPASLTLRQEINPRSPVVATVEHGEKLEIIQKRRRFTRVRTAKQVEGWTDDSMLLSAQQMDNLRRLGEKSNTAPSQGVASTYEVLNVHIAPERLSPSFLQIKEGEKFDVIGHRVTPRNPPAPPRPPALAKTRSKKASREKKSKDSVAPPPMPRPPALPRNWRELSRTNFEPPAASTAVHNSRPQPPAESAMDDWSMVRTKSGQTGWVLTRRFYMAIPDEVAQYAEGRRITSYFAAGELREEGVVKNNWVWTTVERGQPPYDFDSFRVFTWNNKKRRYETAHIERNVKGYFPMLKHPVAAPRNAKVKGAASGEKLPGFSVVLEKKDGRRYRRSYAFIGNVVRYSGEELVAADSQSPAGAPPPIANQAQPGTPAAASFYKRMKEQAGELRKRWFGR